MGKKDRVKTETPTEAPKPEKQEWFSVVHSQVDNITKIKITKFNSVVEATEKKRVPSIVVTREQLTKVVKDLLP